MIEKNQQENTSFTQIDHLDVYDSSYLLYRKWFFIIKFAIL